MAFEPKQTGRIHRIIAHITPPGRFIAAAVYVAMVPAAQWDGELVADLSTECSALRKAEMMGIGWSAAANQAGMLGDRSDVIPVTHSARFGRR